MASGSQPLLQEHESFAGDHVLKVSTLQGQVAVHRDPLTTQSRQTAEGSAMISDLESGDQEDLHRESKRAPAREIFNHLSTAVSSTRSDSAKGQCRSDTSRVANDEDEAGSTRSQRTNPFADHTYPALSDSAVSFQASRSLQSMDSEFEDMSIAGKEDFARQPQPPQSSNPWTRTLAAFSSSLSRNESSQVSSEARVEPAKNPSSCPPPGVSQSKEKMTPTVPTYLEPKSSNWSRIRNRIGQPSLQEGSTIDNILRQYKGSDAESFASRNRPTLSFGRNLSQMSDDESFFSECDENRGVRQAGDHRQGRSLTQENTNQQTRYTPQALNNGLPRSTARNDISSVGTGSDNQDSSDLADITDIRSKYGPQRRQPSPRFTQNHQPLERAIMELRRQSDANISSSDSRSTIQGTTPTRPPQRPGQAQVNRPVSDISIDEETRRLAEPILFYNRASVDPNWNVENAHCVRVPIQHRPLPSQGTTHKASGETIPCQEDDGEDWETVNSDPSYREAFYRPRHGNQTLSSFAETSDAGTLSTFESMSRFGSTERIVQHPGDVRYGGRYRQLELKQGNIPIMAPSKGPYRVNGYSADSMRTRPTQPFYTTPSPLGSSHQNPFMSQPPEVMSPNSKNRIKISKPQEGRERFQTSSSSIATNESQAFPRVHLPRPKVVLAAKHRARMDVQDEDEDDSIFSSQSSFATNRPRQLGRGRQVRRQQHEDWDVESSFAKPGGYQHYGARGKVGASGFQLSGAQGDGFDGATLYAGQNGRATRAFPHHIPIEINRPNQVKGPGQVNRPEETFDIEDPEHVETNPRQEKISLTWLLICNFFPPLLVFFRYGKLDLIMSLLTSGEIREFSMRKKKAAGSLIFLWLFMLVVGACVYGLVKMSIAVSRTLHLRTPPTGALMFY